MGTFKHMCLVALSILTLSSATNTKMKNVIQWKQVDFEYPSAGEREEAIISKKFIPENNLPLGLEVWKDKLFITVPRWKSGVPATLNYVSLKNEDLSPKLIPYPNWESNHLPETAVDLKNNTEENTNIISVFRVRADACDRLWVMDTGLSDVVGEANQVAPPRIHIYSLHNDSLLHSYTLNPSHVKEDSFYANIIVDVDPNNCDKAYAYIPDLGSYAVIVYSLSEDDSWRVKHHYFHFDPLNGNYSVGGVNFQWTDGVFAIALSTIQDDGYRTAYFHPLSSTYEFAVSTRILQNKTLATDPHNYHEFKKLGTRGPNTQSSASFLDEPSGVLFYTQVNRDAIGCWNSHNSIYSPDTQALVTSDDATFIFPNDLKIDRESNLWVLTDRLPVFIYRSLKSDDTNFYVFKASVKDLIGGTVCDKPAK